VGAAPVARLPPVSHRFLRVLSAWELHPSRAGAGLQRPSGGEGRGAENRRRAHPAPVVPSAGFPGRVSARRSEAMPCAGRPRSEALGRRFLRTEPLCPRPLETPPAEVACGLKWFVRQLTALEDEDDPDRPAR
jgi:hypothetical protein